MRVGAGRRWWSYGFRGVAALGVLRLRSARQCFQFGREIRQLVTTVTAEPLQLSLPCHPERSRFFACEEVESRTTPITLCALGEATVFTLWVALPAPYTSHDVQSAEAGI